MLDEHCSDGFSLPLCTMIVSGLKMVLGIHSLCRLSLKDAMQAGEKVNAFP